MFQFIKAKSKAEARELYPGAAVYVKYRKGYRVFDYIGDYEAYLRQFGMVA